MCKKARTNHLTLPESTHPPVVKIGWPRDAPVLVDIANSRNKPNIAINSSKLRAKAIYWKRRRRSYLYVACGRQMLETDHRIVAVPFLLSLSLVFNG